MKIGTTLELRREMRRAYDNGFRFVVYECTWRGRPFIAEITGTRHTATGLAGFSYQSCELKQPQLRRIKQALDVEGILTPNAPCLKAQSGSPKAPKRFMP